MNFSRCILATMLAIPLFASASNNIKVTLIKEGSKDESFVIEAGKPFFMDDRQVKRYEGFVGCAQVDTSRLLNHATVGRQMEIMSTPFALNSSAAVKINYSYRTFAGTTPMQTGEGCVINNPKTWLFEFTPTVFLTQNETHVIDMPIESDIQKIKITID